MRKVLSLFITLVLILSLTTLSFAAPVTETEGFMENPFVQFILEYNLQYVFVLILLGRYLKSAGWFKDKFIPPVLWAVAFVLILFTMLAFDPPETKSAALLGYFIVRTIAQAFFVTGAAVLSDQIPKQLAKNE